MIYDTSKLTNNDLIKVLRDSTHNDAITYYRWSGSAFNYVGAEGPYYTTAETDTLLNGKQDKIAAGSNIQIAADGKTISATDTTYSAGTNEKLDTISNKIDGIELNSTRNQLLTLMSNYPNNESEILKVADYYFNDLNGDWYMTELFSKWGTARGIDVSNIIKMKKEN